MQTISSVFVLLFLSTLITNVIYLGSCGGHWFDSHWFDKKAFSASLYAAFSHPKELFELSFSLLCTTCMVNTYPCFLLLLFLSLCLSLCSLTLSRSQASKQNCCSEFPVGNKQKINVIHLIIKNTDWLTWGRSGDKLTSRVPNRPNDPRFAPRS